MKHPGRTEIYRLYDADDRLLYVGIAYSAHHRLMGHVCKPWWPDVARKVIGHHRTREAALRAEARAIRRERPIYNVQGRRPHTADERAYIHQRAVAAIGRAIAPASGIRARRRYEKAAAAAIEAGYLDPGYRPEWAPDPA